MLMISMGGEARTPSYHTMGSPRYGGCMGAILHFFDWNPGKRFYSTKRLAASKAEEGLRRSRSLRGDHGLADRTRRIFDSQPREDVAGGRVGVGVFHDDSGRVFGDDGVVIAAAASSRAPSVVARLMGLESLPKSPYLPARHRRSQSCSGAGELPFTCMAKAEEPPVVLQELLQRDFKGSKKTLRDRMPAFAKRAQEQYENRFAKKGAALKALRCRDDDCLSPYIDVHDVQPKSKQPSPSRLAPAIASAPRDSSPSEVSTPGIFSEFGSQAAGWPLAGQVSRESSFRSERSSLLESECSSSRPAITKSSNPALAVVARKIFQGRRRAPDPGWNGSEGSETSSSQVNVDFRSSPQHRKPRVPAREPPLKKVSKSLSPPARRDRTIRTTAASSRDGSARDFKTSGTRLLAMPKAVQSIRTSSITPKSLSSSEDVVDLPIALADQRQPLIHSRSRSTDFQSAVLDSVSSRPGSPASGSHESTSSASQTSRAAPIFTVTATQGKRSRPSANFARISKPDVVPTPVPPSLPSKAPALDGNRAPKLTKQNQRIGLPKRTVNPAKLLPAGNTNAHKGGVASSKQSAKNTLQGIQRARVSTTPPLSDTLKPDELPSPTTTPVAVDTSDDTPPGSPTTSMAPKLARAQSIGDVFPEIPPESPATPAPISSEVDTKISKPPVAAIEGLCEKVSQVDLQEIFAAGADDLRWEDEERRVELESPELNGCFCERSCSGPSVSSASVDVSDIEDERDGDAWSSCASYDAADCDSPRTFELPDTDAEECDLHEPKSTAMYVKKLPTLLDETPSQPSPVSVLDSPFHDDDAMALHSDEDDVLPCCCPPAPPAQALLPDPLPTHLHQAQLDISLLQSFTFSYKDVPHPTELPRPTKESEPILAEAQQLQPTSPPSFDQEAHDACPPDAGQATLALSPSSEDRNLTLPSSRSSEDRNLTLASSPSSEDRNLTLPSSRSSEDRKLMLASSRPFEDRKLTLASSRPFEDQKLLQDAVSEARAWTAGHHWRCAEVVPGRGCVCATTRARARALELREEVEAKVEEWRRLTAVSVDLLVEKEVVAGEWRGCRGEVAAVGGEIETGIWTGVVEDVVGDLVATNWKRSLR